MFWFYINVYKMFSFIIQVSVDIFWFETKLKTPQLHPDKILFICKGNINVERKGIPIFSLLYPHQLIPVRYYANFIDLWEYVNVRIYKNFVIKFEMKS